MSGFVSILILAFTLTFVASEMQFFSLTNPREEANQHHNRQLLKLLDRINKEQSISTILIMQRRTNLYDCPLSEFHTTEWPILQMHQETKTHFSLIYNKLFVALICLNSYPDMQMLFALSKNFKRMPEGRIILWLNSKQLKRTLIIEKVRLMKFLKLILIQVKGKQIEIYQWQPFPKGKFQLIANLCDLIEIYPKYWSNYQGKVAITLPNEYDTLAFLGRDVMTRKISLMSPVAIYFQEFAAKHNITLEYYQAVWKADGTRMNNEDLTDKLLTGELDFAEFAMKSMPSRMVHCQDYHIASLFIVVPCSHKVNISKVYTLFFGNIWLFYIIIMYLIFSIIEALLVKISHHWENMEHRGVICNFLINLRVFGHMLGIATMWRGRHSFSLRQIVITMSVFGLVFSTFFAAKLSAIMTKPPEYSDIESFMDLRASQMPVFFPLNSQRIIETFLGANHFAALLPNARFIPLKNWSDLALSFNSSNAYQVTATSWAAINSYQMFFNRRIFCRPPHLDIVSQIPASVYIQQNSIYELAINDFLYYIHEYGFSKHWSSGNVQSLLAAKPQTTPNMRESFEPLILDHIAYAFRLILLGQAMSCLLLLIEICVAYYSIAHSTRR